jgi:hypothetical protein
LAHPESIREKAKEYRLRNRDKLCDAKRIYYYANAERLKEKQRQWNKVGSAKASKTKQEKWPEKIKAAYAARKYRKQGFHAHHWNYAKPTEVIYLTNSEHNLLHRKLEYKPSDMWFNDLDTFEKHYQFTCELIGRKPEYNR